LAESRSIDIELFTFLVQCQGHHYGDTSLKVIIQGQILGWRMSERSWSNVEDVI